MSFRGVKDVASYVSGGYCDFYEAPRGTDPRVEGKNPHDKLIAIGKRYFEQQGFVCETEARVKCKSSTPTLLGSIDLLCRSANGKRVVIIEAKTYRLEKLHQQDIAQLLTYVKCIEAESKEVLITAYLLIDARSPKLVKVNPNLGGPLSVYLRTEKEYRPGPWCLSCVNNNCIFKGESVESHSEVPG